MELRKAEKPLETCSESQTSPCRQPESKRRFRVVKLEERIAPCSNRKNGSYFLCCTVNCFTTPPGHCK
jgi:hypothetical protein